MSGLLSDELVPAVALMVPCPISTTDPALATATLEELAELAATEYQRAGEYLVGALGHFVRFGEVLLVARSRLDADGRPWIQWLRTIGIEHQFTADRAMRLAFYRDHLPADAFKVRRNASGRVLNPSWNNALLYLRGLPAVHSKAGRGYPPETKSEAMRLHQGGMTLKGIAGVLGVGESTIRYWVLPGEEKRIREKNRRRKAKAHTAATALRKQRKREERDALARQVGGNLSTAYGNLRRTLASLDAAADRSDPVIRALVSKAISQCHSAENSLVEAIQAERATLS